MLKNPEATAPIDKQPDEEPNRLAEPVDTEQPPRLPFAVVGVGGSAGGLEAFTELFKAMPDDSGMAFVLIQHLPPQRESMMADILSRHTKMPVQEVEDRMPVQRNHVYVIRPGHTMTIKDGLLHLGERVEKPGHSRPVDDFFKSLAEEQRERAIGVIMSGMGSNGSAGAQAIKAVGGICIAQDPDSAKFPSMPRHLIESGLADFILRAKEIPEVLLRYASHPYAKGTQSAEAIMRLEKQHFSDILAILRTRTRQDFNGYKKPTVLRRIQRRMGLNQITRLSEYAKMLRQNPSEVSTLSDDLMIHVTGFFRDADAWESLRKQVIVPMIRRCENNAEVRCWVTACSSGEEAYTLAILLAEEAAAVSKPLDIKIFATDTADRTLSHARGGLYPGGIEAEITPQRLERFFEKDDSFYRVRKELREMVVFAPQNVLSDPPFSRLDIATCRNLLIYLEPPMQRRVLALLHFGLRESGTLFLGTSETVAGAEEMFEPIDKKWRIFRRVGPTRHGTVEFPLSPLSLLERDRADSKIITRAAIAQLTNKTLLDQYTPAAVVIDREHRIVFFHGNTEPYMINPRGEPTRDLLAMCRDNIRGAVRAALQQAVSQNQTATVLDGYIEGKQGRMRMAITVAALDPRLTSGFYLVSFEQRAEIAPP
ncbi:MAG TPA: chemotaxis protein CheB, partial [Tepidisphaeraceae bacterium]